MHEVSQSPLQPCWQSQEVTQRCYSAQRTDGRKDGDTPTQTHRFVTPGVPILLIASCFSRKMFKMKPIQSPSGFQVKNGSFPRVDFTSLLLLFLRMGGDEEQRERKKGEGTGGAVLAKQKKGGRKEEKRWEIIKKK